MHRSISVQEAKILERALAVGAKERIASQTAASISSLCVTASCKCGCATVWFGPTGDSANGRILADARATSDDQDVDVLVWAIDDTLVGLEFVGGHLASLPDPASVRGYGDA